MANEVKRIASLVDGRICPWYCVEDPIPEKFVVIPDALWARHLSGKITDGKVLAKMALMQDGSEVGTVPQNVAPPPKEPANEPAPDEVDPESIPQGEPTQPNVTHFPKPGTMRA